MAPGREVRMNDLRLDALKPLFWVDDIAVAENRYVRVNNGVG